MIAGDDIYLGDDVLVSIASTTSQIAAVKLGDPAFW